jgi:serine O-acetyltransferase
MTKESTSPEAALASADSLSKLERALKALRPPLLMALAEDARMFSFHRGERCQFTTRREKWLNVLRLAWTADDYLGLALYRFRTSLQAARIPILPRMLHLLSVGFFGIRIGDHVALMEGAYIPHGQVVIDGIVLVGRRCLLAPWTTLGVVQGDARGPKLGDEVFVGTGAKILGDVRIGDGARIGANSVVLADVPPKATVVGVPARIVEDIAAGES